MKTIRYYVCGIGYDKNDCVTDYEREFGDFDTVEEAYHTFVKLQCVNPSIFFEGVKCDIAYIKLQLEECNKTDEGTCCIDVINEYDICKFDNKVMIWKQYIIYLTEWAKDHRDAEYYGMSPADFDEWYDNEFCEVDDDRSEMPWDYSKHFD